MSKGLWIVLLVVTGALALWRGGVAGIKYFEYQRLAACVPGYGVQAEVVPKSSKFALQVLYSYDWQGKQLTGKAFLRGPYYLNRGAAEGALKKISGMSWEVYLDARHPSFSTLERSFPLKDLTYGIILMGIFLYFVGLRIHLALLERAL